jgi:hypothetical protein
MVIGRDTISMARFRQKKRRKIIDRHIMQTPVDRAHIDMNRSTTNGISNILGIRQ